MNRSLKSLFVAAIMVASGCTADGGGIVDIKPDPDLPTVDSIVLTWTTASLMPGESAQVSCAKLLSNGRSEVCGSEVSWSGLPSTVVSVTAGMVKAITPGEAQVTASVAGKTASVKVVVKPLPVTLVGIAIVGDSVVDRAGRHQNQCLGKYSDGTEKVLSDCFWSLTNPDTPAFLDGSDLHILAVGTVYLTVTYSGFQASLSVRLVGTPISRWDLHPLVRDLILSKIKEGENGKSGSWIPWKMASGQKTVYIGPGFDVALALSALDEVSKLTGGKLTFVQHADSASAVIYATTDMTGHTGCGWAGYESSEQLGLWAGGNIRVRVGGNCPSGAYPIRHEFIHVFGFPWHTREPGVMSETQATMEVELVVVKYYEWLHRDDVVPGMVIVEG